MKGNHPSKKKPAVHLTQLEEEGTNDGEDPESDNPDGIKGVTEEFMVKLARAVKDTQSGQKVAAIIAAALNILFVIVCS